MKTLVFSLAAVWFAPRTALRCLVERPLPWTPFLLAVCNGIRFFLEEAQRLKMIEYFGGLADTVIVGVVVGPLCGVALLDLQALLLYLVGQLLGGRGNFARVRAAVALSYVPLLTGFCFISLVAYLLFGEAWFTGGDLSAAESVGWIALAWGLVSQVFLPWSIIVLVLALAEAHQVSAWRALALTLLAVSPLLVLLVLSLVDSPRLWLWFFISLALLVVVVVLGSFLLPGGGYILRLGRTPPWLSRWANRKLFRASTSDPGPDPVYGPGRRWVLFPFTVEFCLLSSYVLVSTFLPIMLPGDELFYAIIMGILWGTGLLLFGLACYQHLRVDGHRRLKYELALSGLVVLYYAGLTAHLRAAATAAQALPLASPDWWQERWGEYGVPAVWLLIFGALFARLFRFRHGQPTPPSAAVRSFYRLTQWPLSVLGVVFGYVTSQPQTYSLFVLLVVYMALRYVVLERMLAAPIVFLRSFHDLEAAVAFGRVVMKAAKPYAPVVALTHALQPPEQLQAEMSPQAIAQLYTSADANWQQWVTQHLRRCTAVIIDATLGTQGVQWELEQAYRLVPEERIAVLVRGAAHHVVPERVQQFHYQIGWAGKRQLRKALAAWLRRLPDRQPLPADTAPAPQAIALPVGRQIEANASGHVSAAWQLPQIPYMRPGGRRVSGALLLLLLVIGGILASLDYAGDTDRAHETLIQEMISTMNDLADVMSNIKHLGDATAMAPQAERIQAHLEELFKKYEAISENEQTRLATTYGGELKAATARVERQNARLGLNN